MNIEQINKINDFTKWARNTLNKVACFEINFWSFSTKTDSIEYRIYVEGLLNKTSKDINELIEIIPSLYQYCFNKQGVFSMIMDGFHGDEIEVHGQLCMCEECELYDYDNSDYEYDMWKDEEAA